MISICCGIMSTSNTICSIVRNTVIFILMYCPICNYNDTKVIDSRPAQDGFSIRRRRECVKCEARFSTYEEMELLGVMVLKSDGRKESYDRDKLVRGLNKALEKRSYTQERFQRLVASIERAIQAVKKEEITSEHIGSIVMKHLKKFDKVAFIRFASIYESFDDVETFKEAIEELLVRKKRRK